MEMDNSMYHRIDKEVTALLGILNKIFQIRKSLVHLETIIILLLIEKQVVLEETIHHLAFQMAVLRVIRPSFNLQKIVWDYKTKRNHLVIKAMLVIIQEN